MAGHTEGPWRLIVSDKGWQNPYQIERPDGACLFSFGDSPSHSDAMADARLIAAAPELLSALRGLFDNSTRADWPDVLYEAAEAAIAKAEGK